MIFYNTTKPALCQISFLLNFQFFSLFAKKICHCKKRGFICNKIQLIKSKPANCDYSQVHRLCIFVLLFDNASSDYCLSASSFSSLPFINRKPSILSFSSASASVSATVSNSSMLATVISLS